MTNLSELHEPLIQLIREVSETGRESAKIMYGADGWVLHHNTDIWRVTGAIDKAPVGIMAYGWSLAVPSFVGTLSLYRRYGISPLGLPYHERSR